MLMKNSQMHPPPPPLKPISFAIYFHAVFNQVLSALCRLFGLSLGSQIPRFLTPNLCTVPAAEVGEPLHFLI